MIRVVPALCLALVFAPAVLGQESGGDGVREWATPGEGNGWFAPTSPAQLGKYLTGMAENFEAVALDTLAWVDGGAVEPDSALPVFLATVRTPNSGESERIRVLVLAGERGKVFRAPRSLCNSSVNWSWEKSGPCWTISRLLWSRRRTLGAFCGGSRKSRRE